jgi:hypothetical protein
MPDETEGFAPDPGADLGLFPELPRPEVPQAGAHDYLSTACHHGLHARCRLTCKFCAEPCRCECHRERVSGDAPSRAHAGPPAAGQGEVHTRARVRAPEPAESASARREGDAR